MAVALLVVVVLAIALARTARAPARPLPPAGLAPRESPTLMLWGALLR